MRSVYTLFVVNKVIIQHDEQYREHEMCRSPEGCDELHHTKGFNLCNYGLDI
jgi:cytochrome c-type biogenesis protein CcmE